MPKFAVILPAAGQSTRFSGFRRRKPFVELRGRPVWIRAAEHFLNRDDVCQTIIVLAADDVDWFREQFRASLAFMDLTVVTGGATRAESVRRGLEAVQPVADFVAVHDAARPLLTSRWIDQVFAAAVRFEAAIPGLRVTSTIKRLTADSVVAATVDRSGMVLAQTPQVFARTLLEKAYAACRNPAAATDDASVVEQYGHPVHVVDGWPLNIKITTDEDFRMAEQLISALPKTGGTKSLHPFNDERFL